MGHPRQSRWADYLRRFLATVCATLIFGLGLSAANPSLHAQLHHNLDCSSDDGCVVGVFANGVSAPMGTVTAAPPSIEWREPDHFSSAEFFLDSPRYLLPPEHGPPAA